MTMMLVPEVSIMTFGKIVPPYTDRASISFIDGSAVQNMMGHADTSTTLDVYTHLFDGHLDDLAESLNRDAMEARADLLRTAAEGDHLRVVGGEP